MAGHLRLKTERELELAEPDISKPFQESIKIKSRDLRTDQKSYLNS